MMSVKRMMAIFKKQIKDTLKNRTVLLQFIMFPILSIIMQKAIKAEGLPKNYFVILFASMYIGMAPLTTIAAIISEEKEKNTLRVLMMSNVKSIEYLIGVGSYIFLLCMLGAVVFGVVGNYRGVEMVQFLVIMGSGLLTSLMIGAAIGTWSKNQMAATSITIPVMLIFAFLPMLAMFNDAIRKISGFTYSGQINNLMNAIGAITLSVKNVGVIAVNMAVAIALFVLAYRRSGLA
jgi:ABC-2 type transport system permease protein